MGLFGDDHDKVLLSAIRKRLLDEISSGKRSDASAIVNNVYGSSPEGGGLTERLHRGEMEAPGPGTGGEDPYEYFVDIDRDDKTDEDGHKIGWTKKVRRYRDKKKVP